MAAEFGKPQWTFSMVTYAFVSGTRVAATYTQNGRWKLALIDVYTKQFTPIDLDVQPMEINQSDSRDHRRPQTFISLAARPTQAAGHLLLLRRAGSSGAAIVDERSDPARVDFRAGGRHVHRPAIATCTRFTTRRRIPTSRAPAGRTQPPLIVVTHGGPTGATLDVLDPKVQFWTSRGFAVLDVNYSGSTGYGRPYRDRLKGQWGIVDVEDAVGGAQAMVAARKADPERLIIRGGSAGGYTTLAALTFHDTFKAGASYYGISDLEVLQQDTHKFEARYNDSLIGP